MPPRRNASVGIATMALGKIVGERTDSTRFLRGAELMERSMVSALTVAANRANATVQGSRRESYRVEVMSSAVGSLPRSGSDLRFTCTCPDWVDPCKHAVAVTLELAERLDDDPDMLARFLGLDETGSSTRPKAPTSPTAAVANLATTAPTWARDVRAREAPTDSASFFGRSSFPVAQDKAARVRSSAKRDGDEVLGSDRLRALGPLVVEGFDGFDLAPDLIRLFNTFTLKESGNDQS